MRDPRIRRAAHALAALMMAGLAVLAPSVAGGAGVRVDLNGQDVTSSFAVRADGRFLGPVSGLRLGRNDLTARAPSVSEDLGDDGSGARITITNHPIGGPVFSGPQVQ